MEISRINWDNMSKKFNKLCLPLLYHLQWQYQMQNYSADSHNQVEAWMIERSFWQIQTSMEQTRKCMQPLHLQSEMRKGMRENCIKCFNTRFQYMMINTWWNDTNQVNLNTILSGKYKNTWCWWKRSIQKSIGTEIFCVTVVCSSMDDRYNFTSYQRKSQSKKRL